MNEGKRVETAVSPKGQRVPNQTSVERRSDRELFIVRAFDAPARLVFDAWTKPEILKRWWAPRSLGVTLFECEVDLRVGGIYRFVFGKDPSATMAFSGKFTEVTPHSRLAYTQIFEPQREAGEGLITLTFTERDGKTWTESVERFPSKEVLDGVIATGMEKGMRSSLEQLEELLPSMQR